MCIRDRANVVHALGSGRLDRLAGADRVLPASLFAFGLAGVSLMGLPPSGGFLAKWLLLQAAWASGGWGWIVVVLAGSLLAAAYVFRVLAAVFREPAAPAGAATIAATATTAQVPAPAPGPRAVPWPMTAAALLLGAAAVLLGFVAAPLVDLLDRSAPPVTAR
jgi:formate hydrogenlyase subunit 3/multisubunit Na+/H+ antiporter MnhD subunit